MHKFNIIITNKQMNDWIIEPSSYFITLILIYTCRLLVVVTEYVKNSEWKIVCLLQTSGAYRVIIVALSETIKILFKIAAIIATIISWQKFYVFHKSDKSGQSGVYYLRDYDFVYFSFCY